MRAFFLNVVVVVFFIYAFLVSPDISVSDFVDLLCVYIYVCVCVCVCMKQCVLSAYECMYCTCVCVCVCAMRARARVCVCLREKIRIFVSLHIGTATLVDLCAQCMYACTHVRMYMYARRYTVTEPVRACMRTSIHACILHVPVINPRTTSRCSVECRYLYNVHMHMHMYIHTHMHTCIC